MGITSVVGEGIDSTGDQGKVGRGPKGNFFAFSCWPKTDKSACGRILGTVNRCFEKKQIRFRVLFAVFSELSPEFICRSVNRRFNRNWWRWQCNGLDFADRNHSSALVLIGGMKNFLWVNDKSRFRLGWLWRSAIWDAAQYAGGNGNPNDRRN